MEKQQTGQKGVRTVHAVAHLSDILRCVSKAGKPVGINEIARAVALDKSSVSRLVASLEKERLLQRGHDGGVRLGLGLLAIAAPLMRDLGLSTRVRPSLEALAKRTGETVNLSVWSGTESVSVVQALGSNAITHYAPPGRTIPPHCSASGKVLLAFASEEVIESVLLQPLQRYSDKTITDPDILRGQLQEIRRQGYAVNIGELAADVCAIGAAVFDLDGSVVGALTVTVPAYRFDVDRQAEILSETLPVAHDLSAQFGFRS
ncbi:MAG: IclR family transcriptional regulator [Rhizobiaceae bacterium]|nr:IclR family transcriptional regulator [Rhizobiaceae bacterium]